MYRSDVIASAEKAAGVVAISFSFAATVFVVVEGVNLLSGRGPARALELSLIAFVFSVLALVTGMITGASRSAAVGQVLPAALGFIGGVALYVITKNKAETPVAATAVVSFSVLLLLGTVLGSYERVRATAWQENERYDLTRLKAQADAEFLINGYRRSRGLEPLDFSE